MKNLIVLLVLIATLHGSCWAADKTITEPLKSTQDGQLFYVQLAVGANETRQTFNMLVATDYYTTWIPSVELSSDRGYNDRSAKRIDTCYNLHTTGTGYVGYKLVTRRDRVQFGSQVIEDQQFAVVSPSRFSRNYPIDPNVDGMLALNGDCNYPKDVSHLFTNLHQQKLIDRLKYSLYINKTAVAGQLDTKGALVLGGVDRNYYTGDFNYVKSYLDPVDNRRLKISCQYKSLIISGVQLDWSRASREMTRPLPVSQERVDMHLQQVARMKLDSTTKLFVGDSLVLDRIHLDMMGASKVGKTGVYVFADCLQSNKPDFVFSVDGLELTVTPEDYVIEEQVDGRQLCLSAFKPYKRDLWVFGTRFLRKFYTLFDYENDVVGFATPT